MEEKHLMIRSKNKKIYGHLYPSETLQFDVVSKLQKVTEEQDQNGSPVEFRKLRLGFGVTNIAVTEQTFGEMIALYLELKGFTEVVLKQSGELIFYK